MTKVYREKRIDNRCNPPARPFGGRGATERSQGHVDWRRNVRQTSIASTGCTARRTSTAKIEVAGSSKSTKSHRRIAILTATSKSLHPSQKVKIISPSRSLPMRTVQHCLKKDGNSAKRHRVSAPTQYKKERENKITVFHFTFHLGTQPVKHPAPRPLHLHSIYCWLRDVPRLTVNAVARTACVEATKM